MAKKSQQVNEDLNIDSILFKCRDILRNARNSGSFFEKRDMMLTLIFLRFMGEKYEDGLERYKQDLRRQGIDLNDEAMAQVFLETPIFTDGTYNLPPEARWSTIINTPGPGLNVALDTALRSLAQNDSQLKGCFVEGTFTQRSLAPNDIKRLIDEVNKISQKKFVQDGDLIGYVYEYFLKEFAVNATKEDGEFYTPHDIVKLITNFIEPYDGTIFDPACGSGGMFIQSAELVAKKTGDMSRINVYGQEKEPATHRLAKMNLVLRGISHHLGEEAENSFTNDIHDGLYFDYIMANPPFNLKGWWDDNLINDKRWADFALPPESNANYAWILHMLSHLNKDKGVAGFLLANGALGDSDGTAPVIRQKLLEKDVVEAIVVLPRELFITTDISVTMWILNMNKRGGKQGDRLLRDRRGEVLFMDLRSWTLPEYNNAVKGMQKKKFELSADQIARAAAIYHRWQEHGTDGTRYAQPELYRSVSIAEIGNDDNRFSLVPSRYIEFVDRDSNIDYDKVLREASAKVSDLLRSHTENTDRIRAAFNTLGYECK